MSYREPESCRELLQNDQICVSEEPLRLQYGKQTEVWAPENHQVLTVLV